jgi:uncharacterized protein YukE
VSPNGTPTPDRWVTNEQRIIMWTSNGTMANVLLDYSTDGGVTYQLIQESEGTANDGIVANDGSFTWTVPNNQSTTARVRVSNPLDLANGFDVSDANFRLDLYQITFEMRDLLSNAHLSGMSATGTHSTNPALNFAHSGWNSPVVKGLAAGSYSVLFTNSNYGDVSTTVVVDQDRTVVTFHETKVVHVWEAISELAYAASTDTASIATTLKRDGITVNGASSAMVEFFIPGVPVAFRTFSNPAAPDANGFYNFTWNPPTGLNSGVVYNVVTTINLASTGAVIKTPRTFSIALQAQLNTVQQTVNTQLDKPLSQVEAGVTSAVNTQLTSQTNTVTTLLNTQTTNLNTQLAGQTNTIATSMNAQTAAIDSRMVSFETNTNTQITKMEGGANKIDLSGVNLLITAEKSTATNKQFGGALIYANEVLAGQENVKIVYQADEGLRPTITILVRGADGKEKEEIKDANMTPNTTQPDMYEYTIKKITSPPYLVGQPVSVVVKAKVFTYELDPEKAGATVLATKVGSFMVTGTTLDAVASSVSGLSGMSGKVSETLRATQALQATFGSGATNISDTLGQLSTQMEKLPAEVKRAAASANQGETKKINSTLNEVAKQIQTLAGDNMGFDFSQIMGKALEESSGLKEVRKKTSEVQGTTELMQILMERKLGGVYEPVVHTIME